MDMPFIFTDKPQILYMLQKEETHLLKETLVNKVYQQSVNALPFGFTNKANKKEKSLKSNEILIVSTSQKFSVKAKSVKDKIPISKIIEPMKKEALAKIIGVLLVVVT